MFLPQPLCPVKAEESTGSAGTGGTDGCDLPYGFWEVNLDTLQEEPVLITAEPSLCPQD